MPLYKSDKIDILKSMTANRVALGITTNAIPATKAQQVRQMQKVKSLRERRRDIIDSKPKAATVRAYFEDLIQQSVESSSEED